jgi:uncharacterized protein with PIN domain
VWSLREVKSGFESVSDRATSSDSLEAFVGSGAENDDRRIMSLVHKKVAEFRFYEELNDFLSAGKKKETFPYRFSGTPSVKDAIEAIGVPHTEVELIIVNGESVGFGHRLGDGDRVSVYPVFESLDVAPLIRLRERPLRVTRFVADVHLGTLARRLRILGFDTIYQNDYTDEDVVELSLREHRIILTRDRGLLKNARVTHGHWVRSTEPNEQAREVVARFDLASRAAPFSRCAACNGLVEAVDIQDVVDDVPERAAVHGESFRRCSGCRKVYWKGSHYDKLKKCVHEILSSDNLDD